MKVLQVREEQIVDGKLALKPSFKFRRGNYTHIDVRGKGRYVGNIRPVKHQRTEVLVGEAVSLE